MHKKNLVIFDFDQTIIDLDSEFSLVEKYAPDLYKEKNGNLYVKDHWIEFNNYIYTRIIQNGYNYEDVKRYFSSLELSPNMEELLIYLKENKNKYETVIITGNNDQVVDIVLSSHNIKECFEHILCNKSVRDEKNIFKIWAINEKYEHCVDDKPFLCKSLFFEDFIKDKKDCFDKIFYIGDGANDFCLSKKLGINDIVFPRINYSLYKILYEKNGKNDVKAQIFPWNNGKEILETMKKY